MGHPQNLESSRINQSLWQWKPRKKLRTHKDTIKYISWILHHCFARRFVMFLEFSAPDWPLQNPKQGLKASKGLYKIPTCSNLGCPPRFLTHVLDFIEASLVFNPCFGFCRGPHPPPKHTIPNLISTIQWYSRPSKTIKIIHEHPHEHKKTYEIARLRFALFCMLFSNPFRILWVAFGLMCPSFRKRGPELKCLLTMFAPRARAEMVPKIYSFLRKRARARGFKGSRANQNHANPNSMKGHHSRHTWGWFKWMFVRAYFFWMSF